VSALELGIAVFLSETITLGLDWWYEFIAIQN